MQREHNEQEKERNRKQSGQLLNVQITAELVWEQENRKTVFAIDLSKAVVLVRLTLYVALCLLAAGLLFNSLSRLCLIVVFGESCLACDYLF